MATNLERLRKNFPSKTDEELQVLASILYPEPLKDGQRFEYKGIKAVFHEGKTQPLGVTINHKMKMVTPSGCLASRLTFGLQPGYQDPGYVQIENPKQFLKIDQWVRVPFDINLPSDQWNSGFDDRVSLKKGEWAIIIAPDTAAAFPVGSEFLNSIDAYQGLWVGN